MLIHHVVVFISSFKSLLISNLTSNSVGSICEKDEDDCYGVLDSLKDLLELGR